MAWLGTYAYRRALLIDGPSFLSSDNSGSALKLSLSSSAGLSGADGTDIFSEIGSNYLKIAVILDDGLTEVNVEVDFWDSTGGIATLMLYSPSMSISSSALTYLYLYYDSAASDNTAYVKDNGDSNVWESDYIARWALAGPDVSDCLIDSSSFNVDLSSSGEPLVTAQAPNSSQHNLYLDQNIAEWLGGQADTRPAASGTIEIMFQPLTYTVSGTTVPFLSKTITSGVTDNFTLALMGGGDGRLRVWLNSGALLYSSKNNFSNGTWYHVCLTFSSGGVYLYIDNVAEGYSSYSGGFTSVGTSYPWAIGGRPGGAMANGLFSDVRIRNTPSSTDDIALSYLGSLDQLFTLGDRTEYEAPPEPVVLQYQERSPFFTYEDMFTASDENSNAMLLASHLPIGRAWQNGFRSDTNLGKLVAGLAVEYYRLGVLMGEIPIEMDIEQTNQLLVEWEQSCGIPGDFFTISGATLERRRLNLKMIFTNFGGVQVAADFERVAEYYGFDVDVMPLYYHGSGFPYSWPLSFAQETNKFTKHTILVSIIDNPTTGAIQFPLVFPLPFYSDRGTTLLKTIFELLAPANVNIEFTVYSAQ